jgi:peptidoglycan hydrolase CwlO-like protein
MSVDLQEDPATLKVLQLKQKLKEAGLEQTGNKAALVKRLRANQAAAASAAAAVAAAKVERQQCNGNSSGNHLTVTHREQVAINYSTCFDPKQ